MNKTSYGDMPTTLGHAAVKVAQVRSLIRLGKGTPRPAPHSASTRHTCYIEVPVLEGGAAVGPAVLGWSTPSSGHAVRVSARPAAAILMLLPGVVDACVASGALVKI